MCALLNSPAANRLELGSAVAGAGRFPAARVRIGTRGEPGALDAIRVFLPDATAAAMPIGRWA